MTSNGKIDRQAFPAVAHETAAALSGRSPGGGPQTETEKALAAIWADLLKLERSVGLHEDFFDLGGHSLLAIRSISRIRDAFEVDVQLRNLFEQPTLSGLAEIIDGLAWVSKPQGPRDSGDREEITL